MEDLERLREIFAKEVEPKMLHAMQEEVWPKFKEMNMPFSKLRSGMQAIVDEEFIPMLLRDSSHAHSRWFRQVVPDLVREIFDRIVDRLQAEDPIEV